MSIREPLTVNLALALDQVLPLVVSAGLRDLDHHVYL